MWGLKGALLQDLIFRLLVSISAPTYFGPPEGVRVSTPSPASGCVNLPNPFFQFMLDLSLSPSWHAGPYSSQSTSYFPIRSKTEDIIDHDIKFQSQLQLLYNYLSPFNVLIFPESRQNLNLIA